MGRLVTVGDVLGGKYRIERLLGAGGVGLVAEAVHLELGQRVAIKVLKDDVEGDLKERFLREARASVRLKSEHVVRVTDVGRSVDGAPYIVMELLAGEDLGHMLTRGPLTVEFAVSLILQACEGLAEAHAHGIVHRDLKPRNLFLTQRVHGDPLLKVLDFGIAKTYDPNSKSKELTATESVFGSPQYMSPEQMRATRNVDARADVWSLGVCLYELLTGTLPFDAPTVPLICVQVLTTEPPSLLVKRPDVPPDLWNVIQRCLSKDPDARWSDVAQLAGALEPFAPSARGATLRVGAVLRTPPMPMPEASGPLPQQSDSIGDTRTAQSFDTGGDRKTNVRTTVLVVAAAAMGVIALAAVLYGARVSSAPTTTTSVGQESASVRSDAPLSPVKATATVAPAASTPIIPTLYLSVDAGRPTTPKPLQVKPTQPPPPHRADGGKDPSRVF